MSVELASFTLDENTCSATTLFIIHSIKFECPVKEVLSLFLWPYISISSSVFCTSKHGRVLLCYENQLLSRYGFRNCGMFLCKAAKIWEEFSCGYGDKSKKNNTFATSFVF